MWIKELRTYDIEVYKDNELIYSGSVDEAPEEIREIETTNLTFQKKNIRIDI